MTRLMLFVIIISFAWVEGVLANDYSADIIQAESAQANHQEDLKLRKKIEAEMLRFHLARADSLAENLSLSGYRAYYKTNIYLYRFLSVQDPKDLAIFRERWKPAIDKLEDLPKTDPLRQVMLAELYGKRAALEFLDGKQLKAVSLVRTCHKIIQQNVRRFPQNQAQNKLLGLFNVVFAAVPKKYQWLTNVLGYRGDMDLGMRQLAAAAYYGETLPLEAELIAYYMEKNTLGRPDLAIRRMEKARKRHGAGMLTDFLLASAYSVESKGDLALKVLAKGEAYKAEKRTFFIPYWDYVQAKCFYYREAYPQAKKSFSNFLDAHKGNIYKVDASFRLGMTEVFLGEDEAAQARFKELLTYSVSPFDEDGYAEALSRRFAEYLPGKELQLLFRARNRFDGGYYAEAFAILEKLDPASLSGPERTEWHYRRGRIFHAKDQHEDALESYASAVVQTGTGEAKWMQAYASYYMGKIAQVQEKPEQAKAYYRTALSFDDYFYQAGLENRVKAAMRK